MKLRTAACFLLKSAITAHLSSIWVVCQLSAKRSDTHDVDRLDSSYSGADEFVFNGGSILPGSGYQAMAGRSSAVSVFAQPKANGWSIIPIARIGRWIEHHKQSFLPGFNRNDL